MSMPEAAVEPGVRVRYLQWGPVFAGALAAAALSLVLHAFALGLGLSVSSTAPTWRDTSFALVLLSGLYLLLVALIAYSFGGYVAGRLRTPYAAGGPEEGEFRDGVHGLVTWALATMLAGILLLATAQAATRLGAPSAGSSGPQRPSAQRT